MVEVVGALIRRPGGAFARDLQVDGSIQAVSNALRHARRYGWVRSALQGHSGNTSIWYATEEGRKAISVGETVSSKED